MIIINKDNKNNKKILIAMLFFPYAIYLLYKNKKISLKLLIAILIFFSIMIFISIDLYVNPNRTYNAKAKETIININSDIKDVIGSYRKIYKVDRVTYKGGTYHIFSLTTTNGKYIISMTSEDSSNYMVKDIYEVYPERKHIYGDLTTELFPEIFYNFDFNKYGEIEEVVGGNNVDMIKLKTSLGEYNVNIINNKISSIYKKEEDTFNLIHSNNCELDVLPDIKKIFNETKYGNIQKVIGYEFDKDFEVQYLLTDKGIYKVLLNDDGSGNISKNMDN